MIADLLSIANMILGCIAVFVGILLCLHCPHLPYRWLKMINIAVAAYWGIIYLVIFILDLTAQSYPWFGEVFIRPGVTVTLAVMAANAISRYRGCTP